ncbi:hypothetical protein CH373_12975 [Leptospira perolatii]|uniref:Uncharacterized protein n=1 Tax=Leptospira perolatii TaxID=2023191 RepID=A0A2M9ZKP9_9LEPT|nr:hypothetical protein [Leptospira perolatii]PJZ69973.1 hypothetical protein CH360_08710 [Leptospira perolatii]PJZ72619.1 hypothetical protein CH373_12975 [Leptospira perolatii]
MSDWKLESGTLKKTSKNPYATGTFSGCLLLVIQFFLVVFILVGFLFLFASSDASESYTTIFVLFFLSSLFVIIATTISTYNKSKSVIRTLEIDASSSLMRIKETEKPDTSWDLSQAICYIIKKRSELKGVSSTSGSGSRKYFDLYLLRNDGSFFLLESFSDPANIPETMQMFRSAFPLPIKNDAGENLYDPSEFKSSDPTIEKQASGASFPFEAPASRFLKIERSEQGTRVEVMNPKSIRDKLIVVLFFGIFFGAWLFIAHQILSESAYIALVFFVPFSIFFLGILIVSILFSLTKKLELYADSTGLKIRYATGIPLLSYLLALERFFPKQSIRHIRVSRLVLDQDALTIALKGTERKSIGVLAYLFNLQAFPIQSFTLRGDSELIGIWHLMPWVPNSPGYSDLVAAESAIQAHLNLDEERIDFNDLQ